MRSYVEKIVPDWSRYTVLGGDKLVKLPGIQPLLLLHGRGSIEVEASTGLTWTCCGIYPVRINSGGLEAELIEDPDIGYYTEPLPYYQPWSAIEGLSKSLETELTRAYVNPFSWDPLTPLRIGIDNEGPPGCIYDLELERTIYTGPLPPLRAVKPGTCHRVSNTSKAGSASLGVFKLIGEKQALPRGLSRIAVDSCHGYLDRKGGVFWGDGSECVIEIHTPYYDYRVSILYPSWYYRFRLKGETLRLGPVPALVIGLWSKIALTSRNGVVVELGPGKLTVRAMGSLRIALGGESVAYRIFLEDLLPRWIPVDAPEDGLGNLRSSSGAIMIMNAMEEGEMALSMYNPLDSPGVGEARLPANSNVAIVRGPLDSVDIPVAVDFLRLPLAPGFVGYAVVKLVRKGVFFRFRKRSRRM
ncbi:MAG: hypothetical protein F7C38_08055 [Desulfurococcales archaeon]|nr:hypothetical protein [Desulfurococcales archaeon]